MNEIFCPDTESKKCISYMCPAYIISKDPTIYKCLICKEHFQIGGSCSEIGHTRHPSVFKEFPYCSKYKFYI